MSLSRRLSGLSKTKAGRLRTEIDLARWFALYGACGC